MRTSLGIAVAFTIPTLFVCGCKAAPKPVATGELTTPNGLRITVERFNGEIGDRDDELEVPVLVEGAAGDSYTGQKRRDVKLSIYHGPNQMTFHSISEL